MFDRYVLVDGKDIREFASGKSNIYITAINPTVTHEKKKVFIDDIPFMNGQIDASYAYGDTNFYQPLPFSFTAEIIGKMDKGKTRSFVMEIYRKLNAFISNKIGEIEIETNDEIGIVYKATHLDTVLDKESNSEHVIVTFNFTAAPYRIKKIGGKQDYVTCLDFNDMCLDDCWENAFYQNPTTPNELMFFRLSDEAQHIFVNVSDDVTLSINDNSINVTKGKSEIDTSLFSTENYLKVNKSIEFELYYTFETL